MTDWAAGMSTSAPRLRASTWSDVQPYTPALTSAGSITYTTQTGWYFTAGKLVMFGAYIVVNAAGTGTGVVQFTLPLAPDRSQRQIIGMNVSGATVSGHFDATVLTTGSGSDADLIRLYSGGTGMIGTDVTSGANITCQGCYLAA